MLVNNEKKIDELLNLIENFKNDNDKNFKDINKKFFDLENKEIECKKCKEKEYIDPFSWKYFRNNLFTKKYLVDSIWRAIVKTIVIAILVIFIYDKWFILVDFLRSKIFWNDLGRRYPKLGKKVEVIYEEIEKFNL